MKKLALVTAAVLWLLPYAGAQEAAAVPAPEPAAVPAAAPTETLYTAKTPYYEVSSEVSQAQADELGLMMEALLARYNSFFLQDLSKIDPPLKVRWFRDKASFDAFLADKVSAPRSDFAYLSYKDKTKSLLAGFEGAANPLPSLAFQGFIQYLWTFIPNPPVWVRNGFGYYFWDQKWNSTTQTLEESGSLAFLESARKILAAGSVDLQSLLTLEDKRDGSAADAEKDYQAWALVYFFVHSDNPVYNRILGNVMANLGSGSSVAENSLAALNRISAVRPLSSVSADLSAFMSKVKGFNDYMQEGIALYREFLAAKTAQSPGAAELLVKAEGLFDQAQRIRPADYRPIYYKGLLSYGDANYSLAEARFNQSLARTDGANGLLNYALGLSSFYQKKFPEAKAYLMKAKESNPAEFGSTVDAVMAMLE